MKFNVDTSKLVVHTNRLEKMSRSAFPVAVRGTLNDAAFDVKTRTMPASATSTFKHRQKNFFKANSKFVKADGFNINSMESNIGFYENKLQNQGHNFSIDDLNQQEEGGVIKKKSFIPQGQARKSANGIVRANARLSNIKKIANRANVKGSSWAQEMIKSAVFVGVGGFLLTEQFAKARGGALFRIKSIKRVKGHTYFVAEKLYSFMKGRTIIAKPTHFMQHASMTTAAKMDDFYIKRALDQYRKAGMIK